MDKKPQMILLIGIPASGKSTFVSRLVPKDYLRISLDQLHTRLKEAKMLADALEKRLNVVIDNTNVTRAERQRFIEPAKAAGYEITGYFLQSIIADCLRRNALRTGKARIPNVGVISRFKALELPSIEEGFDSLHYVSIVDEGFSINEWRSPSKTNETFGNQ